MASHQKPSMSTTATSSTSSLFPVLSDRKESWLGTPVISVKQITPGGLALLIDVAHQMKQLVVHGGGGDDRLQHKLMATIFYEASTRTACSFQAAMRRLGGDCIHVDGKGGNSSSKKGESLQDTVRCLESYVDVCVLRHPEKGSLAQVAPHVRKPLINAGDGVGEHPTQALLDFYTMCDELNLSLQQRHNDHDVNKNNNMTMMMKKKSLTICMVGDLKHGRTVHSLAQLLGRSNLPHKITLRYWAPHESLNMPEAVQQEVSDSVIQETVSHLPIKQALEGGVDVLYVTRIQKERFPTPEDYEQVKSSYCIDCQLLKDSPDTIVMHPLPRVDEIATEVDKLPNAAYFRQMENGMYVRMAILALVLGKAE